MNEEFKDLFVDGSNYKTKLTRKFGLRKIKPEIDDPKIIKAFIPGLIKKVYVKEGDYVTRGDKLLVLEAMKMENQILSATKGTIKKVSTEEGNIDFLDERLGENGRGVLDRRQLKVKRGGKFVSICADSINLPTLEELDGLVFAFITRRNTMMPFAQRLTWQQGVLAYLWGESTHSFATVPEKAGESVRIVGMDDFIIGNQGRKINAFYDIVKHLVEKYPGKVHFFQYNTGGMGEIIETDQATGKKTLIRKAKRVPIDLMASLQRGDLRGTNSYRECALKTEEVYAVEGKELTEWNPKNFYSDEQIKKYILELVEGRRKFTDEIASQGLRTEIRDLSHKELDKIEGR